MINIPKGLKDVLPNDSYKWQYIYKVIDTAGLDLHPIKIFDEVM